MGTPGLSLWGPITVVSLSSQICILLHPQQHMPPLSAYAIMHWDSEHVWSCSQVL